MDDSGWEQQAASLLVAMWQQRISSSSSDAAACCRQPTMNPMNWNSLNRLPVTLASLLMSD
jgi:hypothetical protein